MTHWTIMWITALGGPFDGQSSFLVYPSFEVCEASMTTVSDTLPYDHNLACQETTVPSSSQRPKPNPFY